MKTHPPPGVIWITGYSGSGKTSVARAVEFKLRCDGVTSVFLDGDDLRGIFGNRWGYSREERIELAKIYFHLASHLSSQGITVVFAAVAMYTEVREWLKNNVSNVTEVYLAVPREVRIIRDTNTKQIYKDNSNIDEGYDEPTDADLIIKNFDNTSIADAASKIYDYISSSRFARSSDRGRQIHWNSYYNSIKAPDTPSSFAELVSGSLVNGAKLLEIGCGNGRDASFFMKNGHHVTALDVSQAAIDTCISNNINFKDNFVCGTIDRLSDEIYANHFDVIYSRFCLHAMTPDEENLFIAEASRKLKNNGSLCIECRSINDPLARKGEVLSPTERVFGHYRRFIVLDQLIIKLAGFGFKILSAEEVSGVSILGDDNPVVIRVIAVAVKNVN